jgi:DNA-binding LytR/AlgR family response regulator
MPASDGVTFYKSLKDLPAGKAGKIPVIFTTAYSEYAVEGFNVDAIDYLVKPYSHERFTKAVEKADRFIKTPSSTEEGFLFLRADYQLHKIRLADVLYIQSDDDYIRVFFTNSKPKLFRFTLKEIIGKLPANSFARIHRSYVVQVKYIDKIGSKAVFMQEHELPLGASYEEEVKKLANR